MKMLEKATNALMYDTGKMHIFCLTLAFRKLNQYLTNVVRKFVFNNSYTNHTNQETLAGKAE